MVAIDTNCFIYYLEGGPWAEELRKDLFLPLEQGCFRGVTSVLTVAEILVRPKSLGRSLGRDDGIQSAPLVLPQPRSCTVHPQDRRALRGDPGEVPCPHP